VQRIGLSIGIEEIAVPEYEQAIGGLEPGLGLAERDVVHPIPGRSERLADHVRGAR
jgi:hypothetical protein